VLQTILAVAERFCCAYLIVQHIARGFLSGLIEWFEPDHRLAVLHTAHDCSASGHPYLLLMILQWVQRSGRILLTHEEPENSLRPAVSFLFRSTGGGLRTGCLRGIAQRHG